MANNNHKNEKYLSNILGFDGFEKHKINLIVAPCGSGKTTYVENMAANSGRRILYLVDTKLALEAVRRRGVPVFRYDSYKYEYDEEELAEYESDLDIMREKFGVVDIDDEGNEIDADGRIFVPDYVPQIRKMYINPRNEYRPVNMVAMTYASFASICLRKITGETVNKMYENNFFEQPSDTIILDEFQNCISFSRIKKKSDEVNLHTLALNQIAARLNNGCDIISITATPGKIYDRYGEGLLNVIQPPNLRHYHCEHEEHYKNIGMLLYKLDMTKKGLFYVPHIKKMYELRDKLHQMYGDNLKVACIFSGNNKTFAMNELDKAVAHSIIAEDRIPDAVDIVMFNAAMQTSINIKSHLDYIVVHTADSDAQIQSIGRYRSDIEYVYKLSPDVDEAIFIPEQYLNVRLSHEDKQQLCYDLNIRDLKRRVKSWKYVKSKLIKDGNYKVEDKKSGSVRYTIITENNS